MVKMPSAQEIHERYLAGASKAPERYKKGIQVTSDWQQKAIEGEENYANAISQAIAEQRRAKALAAVSNADWQKKALELGAKRIADGMRANAEKRMKNYEPIRQALEALSLPPKTTDPMENIDRRLKAVVQAEIEAKRARLGL